MKKIGFIIFGLVFLGAQSCQKVPEVPSNYVDNPTTATDPNAVAFCKDGTLNCYITTPATPTLQPLDTLDLNQDYNTCMTTCLNPTVCPGFSTLANAETGCSNAYGVCDSQCALVSGNNGGYNNLPKSDPITIPENPKAVLVDITGCYDEAAPYEVHFQGPTASFVTPIEGTRVSHASGFLGLGTKTVKLGYGVSRMQSSACMVTQGASQVSLQNSVQVTFTPVTDGTLAYGNQTLTIVPFDSSVAAVTKSYYMPHSLAFGIPSTIRDQVDLSQVTWLLKDVPDPEPKMGPNSFWGYRYYLNDTPFGTSVVILDYTIPFNGITFGSSVTKQKVSMILLMKSK